VTSSDPDPGSVVDLAGLLRSMPFAVAVGVQLDSATSDEVRGRLDWAADRCTVGGALHGGALMALADSLGAVCAFLNLPDGAGGTSTIESKTNFFRGVREGDGPVTAVAAPLHAGRTTIVVQTDLRDAQGRRVALVTQTQAVIPARAS
jgi:1,4-dihydroxy-2-naphthoyl-CoA hydrolase